MARRKTVFIGAIGALHMGCCLQCVDDGTHNGHRKASESNIRPMNCDFSRPQSSCLASQRQTDTGWLSS